jgi:hypothetical protein
MAAPVLQPPPETPAGLAERIEELRRGGPRPARSPVARMLILFFAIDVVVGIGIAAYFLLGSADPTESPGSSQANVGPAPGPRTLPELALTPGAPIDVLFPEHTGGPTTAELTFAVATAGPWQAWYTTSTVARTCTLTLLAADGTVLLGPLEDSSGVWGWAALPVGPARLRVACEDSPILQQLRVLAGPLPRWDGTSPLHLPIAAGTPAAGLVIPIERDGIWAFQYRGQGLGDFRLLASDGTSLGGGSPSDSATGELTVAAGEYVARFDGPQRDDVVAELSLVRTGPEPLALGEAVVHRPTDTAPRAHWVVKLDAPLRLAVTVACREGSAQVSIADAEGVRVAEAEGHPLETAITAAATTEVPAGEYHVSVLSQMGSEFRIWAHEAGELRLLSLDERDEYATLRGCTCRAEVDAEPGTELVQLVVRNTGSAFELLSQSYLFDLAWALRVGTVGSLELSADEATAPPAQVQGQRVGLGMACAGDTVMVAALDRVTAWSIARRRRLWSTTFDGTYPRGPGAGGDELALNCGRLTLRAGVVAVPLEGGGRANVRVTDGVLQP